MNNIVSKKEDKHAYCAADFWRGGRTRFALVRNALMLDTNALKTRVQTSAPHGFTCSYQ